MGIHPVIFTVLAGEKHKRFVHLCKSNGIHFKSCGRHDDLLWFSLAETYDVLDTLVDLTKGKYVLKSTLMKNYNTRTKSYSPYYSA